MLRVQILVLFLLLGIVSLLHAQQIYKPVWKDRLSGHPLRSYRLDYDFGQWDSVEYASFVYVPGSSDFTAIQRNYSQSQWQVTGRYVCEFDSVGRLLNQWQDYDSVGNWRPMRSVHYTYDIHGIETSYLVMGYYPLPGDTIVARRATITYGAGGLPIEEVGENWTSWAGWGPNETRVYHYNGLLEQDTMWLYYPQLGTLPYETHIFDGWYDFSQRLIDSVTIYDAGVPVGTYLCIKTTYLGNTPQLYHNWDHYAGQLRSERFLALDTNGYYALDSSVNWTTLPQPTPTNCSRWENVMDLQGRRTEERIFRLDTSGVYLPTLRFVYQFDDSVAANISPAQSLQIQVWPNPVADQLNLELNSVGDIQLYLYDMNGRLRLALTQPNTTGKFSLQIPPGVEAGPYMLSVETNGQVVTRKIIVQR